MKTNGNVWRYATWVVAIAILLVLYGFARLPKLSPDERASLAAQFKFDRTPLPGFSGPRHNATNIRNVNPSYHQIGSWVSAIGASVSLADIDGDGLPNDLCTVDPRFDQVQVAPAPGTGARYASFTLTPSPLPYDSDTMAPTGCLPGDFNEDGATDLLVYYWGRAPVIFLRRTAATGDTLPAPSAAQFRPVELVPQGHVWNTSVATQADLDGDGHVDIVLGNYFQDGAAVLAGNGAKQEQMHRSMSRAFNGGINRVFRFVRGSSGPEPTVEFAEAANVFEPDVAGGWTLAGGAADLDGDLRPEIYFANDFGPDRLLYNLSTPGHIRFARVEGVKTFLMPSSKVLGHDSYKGMGVDFGDINGDGLVDIFVSNIANEFALEESHFAFINTGELGKLKHGVAPFVDKSEELGLSRSGFSWEARLADFNNDGVLEAMQADGFIRGPVNRWPELQELAMSSDLFIHNPHNWPQFRLGDDLSGHLHNPFFVQSKSGRFFDLAADCGIGESHVSRGIATADVDGDGKLDFALANQWEDSYLYRNNSPNPGSFLGLHLRLPVGKEPLVATRVEDGAPIPAMRASRPAIGASAVIYLPDGRKLVSAVDGGSGHSGHRSPDIHLGLGHLAPGSQLRVELKWRDSQGAVHHENLNMVPGWHTILLGPEGKES